MSRATLEYVGSAGSGFALAIYEGKAWVGTWDVAKHEGWDATLTCGPSTLPKPCWYGRQIIHDSLHPASLQP